MIRENIRNSAELIALGMALEIKKIVDAKDRVGQFGILITSVTDFDPHFLIMQVGELRRTGRRIRLAISNGYASGELESTATKAGFDLENDVFSVDLLAAGRWRNTPGIQDIPVAIAPGEQPALHTLAAFSTISSADVAKALLLWASDLQNVAVNAQHTQLFQALAQKDFTELHNPLNISNFLFHLLSYKPVDRLNSIKSLLPQLPLLRDPEIFSVHGGLQARLKQNLDLCHRIRYFPKAQQRQVEKKIGKFPIKQQQELLKTLEIVGKYQRTFDSERFEALTLQQVYDLLILKPERTKPKSKTTYIDSDEKSEENEEQTLHRIFAETLLDKDDETRKQLGESITNSIENRDTKRDGQQINISVGNTDIDGSIKADDKLMHFIHAFCSEEKWGGIFETEQGTLRAAIDLYNQNGIFRDPYQTVEVSVNNASLVELLERLDEHLDTPTLLPAFKQYEFNRKKLAPFIDRIVLAPLITIGASTEVLDGFRSYIYSSNNLLMALKDNYDELSAISEKALRICIAHILALDIVVSRLKINRDVVYKAIVMPLHPLHLWKFVRLIEIYQDPKTEITPDDREALLAEAENDRHFLHTLYISEILTEDHAVALPFAGSIRTLPCYENTSNHYSGIDGLTSLFYTLDRFIAFYPLFVRPLRITIIDVPNLPDLLEQVARFLNKHSVDRLPTLSIQLLFTEASASRNYLASLMNGENEQIYQEFIHSGRLKLQIESQPINILNIHKGRPAHVIGLFDQSELAVRDFQRQQFFAEDSPFCITREYQYDQVLDEFQVMPVSDEVLFRNHNNLVNRLRRNLSTHSTSVIGKTQTFRQQLDTILKENCAQWLFIADRVLPAENQLSSPRIFARHEGRREVLVLASTSEHFARELELMLKKYNLYPQRKQVEKLLLDFSHMVGDGLLSIIQAKDGSLMESKSLGLIGMLVAARAYSQQYPDSLIVAIDNQDARRWLRISDTKHRADLIGVRYEEGLFIIESIEVKTYEDEADILSWENGVIKGKAVEQVLAILGALHQTFDNTLSPLDPPRREILRDLFYAECQNYRHNRDFRVRWSTFLNDLFIQGTKVDLHARIYRIDLCHEQPGISKILPANIGQSETIQIELITLGEKQVQQLITGHELVNLKNITDKEDDHPDIQATPEKTKKLIDEIIDPTTNSTSKHSDFIVEGVLTKKNKSVEKHNEIDSAWLEKIRKSFERSCAAYNIKVVPADLNEVIIGHSIIRFPFRLARGTNKAKLDRSLEDIGREMAISNLTIFTNPRDNSLALDVARPNPIIPLFMNEGSDALPEIQRIHELPIVIGVSPDGQILTTDLKQIVHMLIGGTTGAGKTIFLYSVILSLLSNHPKAEDLELVLCTSKLEDFAFFDDIPNLFGRPILSNTDEAIINIGEIANQELERRSQFLSEHRVRSVDEYNQSVSIGHQLKPIVIIVDEFADLADQVADNRYARNEFYTNIRRIAQAGRSRSVHLILCTQRPTSDLFPSNIKTLMNARVAFRMNSAVDSRTILDESGAEKLLGKGDMLFKTEGIMERLQGFFVRTSDIE